MRCSTGMNMETKVGNKYQATEILSGFADTYFGFFSYIYPTNFKIMRKSLALLIAGILLTATVTANSEADKKFTDWKENTFISQLWAMNPVWASQQGFHKYDAVLSIPDEAGMKSSLAFLNETRIKLKEVNTDMLSDANLTDYKLIQNYVLSGLFYQNEFKEYEWNPASYNVGDAIDYVINNNPAPLDEKLRNLSSRLEKVPAYYAAAKHNINKPTQEHTRLAIMQGDGLLSFFTDVFPDSLKLSKLSVTEKDAFNKNAVAAKKAIEDYVAWLKALQGKFTAENTRPYAIGQAMYAKKFNYDIQSATSAQEMYMKAMARKTELHRDMYQLTASLWPQYMKGTPMPQDTLGAIRAMINKLSEKHCKPEDFMATIEKQMPELVQFINNHNLITLDPKKPLKVRKTPEYMAGVAGASINSPGPYDKEGNTYYNVTPLTSYKPEKAESYLREYNNYVLQILNIHEAIPGHYVQLIYSNRNPSVIKTIFGNGAMIEGWACYAERMMIEAGYHKSPEMQLFYDKWNLREVCNFLLDYNVQTYGWNTKEVGVLLVNEGFQQSAEAEEKFKRATLSQVQLASYFAGLTEILELRDEVKKKLGDKFDLKAFHEQFLSYGSAPVKEIRKLMLK
ncbi:MAG: hypothetical protein JWO03_4008 [Bacteroidetes bacterium]|nr:hypothetical protein [Bacteroidota bacterium]